MRFYCRIVKVILMLLNAIKYTPKKGRINIETQLSDHHFIFKIKNTGLGLSKKEQELIFLRFHQLNDHSQGAGIGLSLVKELVKLHNGKIVGVFIRTYFHFCATVCFIHISVFYFIINKSINRSLI